MIQSFFDRETKKIWSRTYSKKFPASLQRLMYQKLLLIDVAKDVTDLNSPPGNRLHTLSGERKGQYSISVNDQWRICFYWNNGNAVQVEIVDYH